MFVDPTHVVEELPERFVSTMRQFEFDDDKFSRSIDCQDVDESLVDREFHPLTCVRRIQLKARLQHRKIIGKKVAQARFKGEALLALLAILYIYRLGLNLLIHPAHQLKMTVPETFVVP